MGREFDTDEDDSYVDEDQYTTDEEGFSINKPVTRSGGTLTPVKNNTALEVASAVVAAASIATSIGAMVVSPVNVVYAAGGLSW